jgi:hypothetical protein
LFGHPNLSQFGRYMGFASSTVFTVSVAVFRGHVYCLCSEMTDKNSSKPKSLRSRYRSYPAIVRATSQLIFNIPQLGEWLDSVAACQVDSVQYGVPSTFVPTFSFRFLTF